MPTHPRNSFDMQDVTMRNACARPLLNLVRRKAGASRQRKPKSAVAGVEFAGQGGFTPCQFNRLAGGGESFGFPFVHAAQFCTESKECQVDLSATIAEWSATTN